jgi:O-antigen/teichoic acid export membrane protein
MTPNGVLGDPGKRPAGGNLISNAVALMISSGGTAVLGLAFWGLATHLTTPNNVGRASAEIAAMVLLANLSELGYASSFLRFIPVTGDRTRRFVRIAYALCIVASLAIALVYVFAGLGHWTVPSAFAWRAFFVLSVGMWTIFTVQDSVLTGLRATRWVPVENILFALAKIALLPVSLWVAPRQGIFLAWVLPVILAIAGVNWYIFRRSIPDHERARPASDEYPTRRELVSFSAGLYATRLISTMSASLVTLIVIAKLGAAANAYYYVPWLIVSGLGFLVWNIGSSFLVEASHKPEALRQYAGTTIRAMTVVLVPSMVVGEVFAPEILKIFGPSYAVHGTTLLRMMLLSLPATSVVVFYSSLSWLDKQVWWLAGLSLASSATLFAVLFSLMGHFGILSVGIASLASSALEVILFLPGSIRRYRMLTGSDIGEDGRAADKRSGRRAPG